MNSYNKQIETYIKDKINTYNTKIRNKKNNRIKNFVKFSQLIKKIVITYLDFFLGMFSLS